LNESSQPNAKVLFRIPNEAGGADVETLCARDLGEDKYQLDNLPYYAYGVSSGDIVLAPFSENEGLPTFEKVITKSGNRTVRIIFDVPVASGNASGALINRLVDIGCDFEGANRKYIVVNIPPSVDLDTVAQLLTSAEVSWEYADPTYETLFPEKES
jgi:hypothetical protein